MNTNDNKLGIVDIIAILAIVFALMKPDAFTLPKQFDFLKSMVEVVTLGDTTKPTRPELVEAGQKVTDIMLANADGKADSEKLRQMYHMINTIIDADTGAIRTTEQLRIGHLNSGRLMNFSFLKADGTTKYPGLKEAVDNVFIVAHKDKNNPNSTGKENTPLNKALAKDAITTLEWAFNMSSK
jgi:hypothetical protein